MRDPFQVLGVSQSATDDEIKKAYRAKCKQYHPDLHPDDPTAEERFKEVQNAYSQIMDQRQGRSSGSASGYSNGYSGYGYSSQSGPQYRSYTDPFGFGGFGFGFDPFGGQAGSQQRQSQESTEFQAARNYIRSGHYQEALHVLNSIPNIQRQGRWYYYNALANSGLGNRVNALESIRQALSYEPDNPEYQTLLRQLQNNMYGYQTHYRQYSSPIMGFGQGNFCLQLLVLNLLCNCCCGGCGMGGFYR